MGDQAKELVWHYDTPSVFFFLRQRDQALESLIFLVCLVVKTCRLKCMFFQEKLLDCCARAAWKRMVLLWIPRQRSCCWQRNKSSPLCLMVQVNILNSTCVQKRRILARVGPESWGHRPRWIGARNWRDLPSTHSRAPVTCWKIMTPRCSLFLQNFFFWLMNPRLFSENVKWNNYCRRLSAFLRWGPSRVVETSVWPVFLTRVLIWRKWPVVMESKMLIRCSRMESSFFVRSSSVLTHSLHSDTQIDHSQVPCRCSAMVTYSQSFWFVSTTTFQVGSRSVAVIFEWNALATHAKTVLSFGYFHDSWFMDIGDSAGPVGWIARTVETRC